MDKDTLKRANHLCALIDSLEKHLNEFDPCPLQKPARESTMMMLYACCIDMAKYKETLAALIKDKKAELEAL